MAEKTKLTAQRGLYYGTMLRAGDTFEARAEDVERLTSGDSPLAREGAARKAAARKFDAENATRDELEAEAERRGLKVKGTGKDGNILVGDLRQALSK